MKYCPEFPGSFASLADARTFCGKFFDWYNNHHHHGGIGLMTPAAVHAGQADQIRAQRALVLDAAHARHSNRFRNPPQPPELPKTAWINHPKDTEPDTQK